MINFSVDTIKEFFQFNFFEKNPDLKFRKYLTYLISQELSYEDLQNLLKETFPSFNLILASRNNIECGLFYFSLENKPHESYCELSLDQKSIDLTIYAKKKEDLDYFNSSFDDLFNPYKVAPNEDQILVNFWWVSKNSPVNTPRLIKCPKYSEIAQNYQQNTHQKVDQLIKTPSPWDLGKIIFWHGSPGTGKTYCVRALIRDWSTTLQPHVILDPEIFMSDSSYLMEVLMYQGDSGRRTPKSKSASNSLGNLIIIEDSPRTILQESRNDSTSFNMGRLLNLTDGILGQGINSIFLMTTNDELREIDNAFLRPGRCLQQLKFEEFESDEANQWLADQKYTGSYKVKEKISLSKLYAILKGVSDLVEPKKSEKQKAGFFQ